MSQLKQLKERLAEITALGQAAGLLGWDQHTYMPDGSAEGRSEQLAVLGKVIHEKFTDDSIGTLLDAAASEVDGLPDENLDKQLVRMTTHDYGLSRKIPSDLVAEDARVSAMAQSVWAVARKSNDFASFAPWLTKNIDIARRKVDCYGYDEVPYDALLNLYEPKMKTSDVKVLFDQVRPVVVNIVKKIVDSGNDVDTSILTREYPEDAQEAFSKRIVAKFGYDFNRGRLDRTVHPFASSFGRDDCRISTRFDKNFLPMAMMGTFHEAGHAMYEQNTGVDLVLTPLAGGCSNSVHESQSRMWENIVGRSRGFWNAEFAGLQQAFPTTLASSDAEPLFRALNKIEPTLIRVEADEVTYNLHIILRFELEQQLLSGELSVADAPEAWNAKVREYLGIDPPNDSEGVLQDVHWAMGGMGYFPTYSLGNFLSAQLFETATAAHPEIPEDIARGEYKSLFDWLVDNVWKHGRRYFPQELIKKATGRELETGPYLKYLTTRFGDIYGLDLT